MKIPKAIIFDAGNTLLEEISYDIDKGIAKTLDELKINYTVDSFNNNLKQTIKDFYTDHSPYEFILIDWLKKFLEDFQIDITPEKFECIVWQNTVVLKPYPDIDFVLSQLKKQGMRLSVLSNTIFSGYSMKYEFSKHNLFDYFDHITTSADIGVRKPDKQIFLNAIDRTKLQPSDILFVGDNLEADIIGAHSVGLKTIWKCENKSDKPNNSKDLFFLTWIDFFNRFVKNKSWV